ncbi:Trypanosomal VSG domain containing protein, putative [Trypanosoma equiperdum]|uniref:Trypanosomal VSG domain containing protein, putative n=1 Tax=Trypanosoma equiperdum TaxID=5694 RepID=A0A1G4I3M7_TRYEQ|nr:Trypanosomal VSG domain containing protein, putative [Trypanosoma equiperdum]
MNRRQPGQRNDALNQTIQEIKATAEAMANLGLADSASQVQAKLNEALYGTQTVDDGVQLTASDGQTREETCGKTGDANSKSRTGDSLKIDVMCLCALQSVGQGAQVCTDSTTATMSINPTGDTDLAEDWRKLKTGCRKLAPTAKLSAASLKATVAALTAYIAAGRTADAKTNFVLGKLRNNGNDGCKATADGADGACVYYGRGTGAGLRHQIKWATNLEEAAEEMEKAEKAAAHAYVLYQKLNILNHTLGKAAAAPTQPIAQSAPRQTQKTPAKELREEAEKECNKKETEPECKTPCKWNAEEKDEKKRCTLSEEGEKAEKE